MIFLSLLISLPVQALEYQVPTQVLEKRTFEKGVPCNHEAPYNSLVWVKPYEGYPTSKESCLLYRLERAAGNPPKRMLTLDTKNKRVVSRPSPESLSKVFSFLFENTRRHPDPRYQNTVGVKCSERYSRLVYNMGRRVVGELDLESCNKFSEDLSHHGALIADFQVKGTGEDARVEVVGVRLAPEAD